MTKDEDETERNDDGTAAGGENERPPGPEAEPVYNDRDKLDFDPDEGFYTGTAVTGDTAIPGEHERVDDVPEVDEGSGESSDDASEDSA